MPVTINNLSELQQALNPKAVRQAIKTFEDFKDPVKSLIFKKPIKSTELPYISRDFLSDQYETPPMVREGGASHPVGLEFKEVDKIELEIMDLVSTVTEKELREIRNNTYAGMTKQEVVNGIVAKFKRYRDAFLKSLIATSLTGTITHKTKVQNGVWNTYELLLGAVTDVPGITLNFTDAGTTLGQWVKACNEARTVLKAQGYALSKASLEILLDETTFNAGLSKGLALQTIDNINFTELDDDGYRINGWTFRSERGSYHDAETQAATNALAEKKALMVDTSADHNIIYCNYANGHFPQGSTQPLYVYSVQNAKKDALSVYGASRPLPAFIPNASVQFSTRP